MSKLKLFLLADGVIVAIGLAFFLYLFLRKKNDNAFRDDLWEQKKQQAKETGMDRKIELEYRPDPKDEEEKTEKILKKPASPPPEFRVPNFYGKPHEVLGLPVNPSKDQVARAYKHWIKRYHPDRVTHLGQKFVDQARKRAEQLNTARDQLLKSIK